MATKHFTTHPLDDERPPVKSYCGGKPNYCTKPEEHMTDLRKAAEMALERLESHEYWMDEEAIQALRQALAQPEQKYDYRVKYDRPCYKCRSNFCPGNCKEPEHLAQPEQEPVECMCGICKLGKREWVDLTDEEIKEYKWMGQDVIAVIKEIQATLKEKNT